MAWLFSAFGAGVEPAMGDNLVRSGLEPGQLLEGRQEFFGNRLCRRVDMFFRPGGTGVQNPPLPLVVPTGFAGVVGHPEQRWMLTAHALVVWPRRYRKMGSDSPAWQNPLNRIIKM